MKKLISLLMVLTLVVAVFATGCKKEEKTELTKVGMVTDSGTIDDKSFNQGTWEGIEKYKADKATIESKYLQPGGEAEADYLSSIDALVESGYKVIVTPGFKFESAIFKAQDTHKDTKFVLIDGIPNPADYAQAKVGENTVSVFFNEHEAGFLAGVASALSTKTGKLGFVGGMEIPPVQKFGWGFKAGVAYANATFGTTAKVEQYIYEGSFNNVAGGQAIAVAMYDSGIDIIFHAAGGVGVGVFNEAVDRAKNGEMVYVVGVDSDQYNQGIYADGKSVTLTSAMKKVGVAAYNYVDAALKGTFPGGQSITLTLKDDAVGLPATNPNLAADVVTKVEEAKKAVLDGNVVVPFTEAALTAFEAGTFK